jgi:hypothetical protein
MSASHAERVEPTASSAWEALQMFVEERRGSKEPMPSFEEFEARLHELVAAMECEAVGDELARFDVDVPVIMVEGIPHRRVVRCEETYFTPAGPVRVPRSLYARRTGEEERALSPMELRAGIVDGRWTPRAAKQAIWFVAEMTPRTVEELYQRLGGLTPSKSALDRLPKKVSADWEAGRDTFEASLRRQEVVPDDVSTVGISLDGVLVPVKNGERLETREQAAAEGKRTRGPAGYEEVGCGTLTFYGPDGTLRSTIRQARMPEANKATLKAMLTAELMSVLAQRPDLTVVRLADGAKDNWTFLDALPVEGPSVVDFWHAAEHLSDALDAAYGEHTPKSRAQFEKLRHVLRHDTEGVEKIIRALVHLRDQHPRSKTLKRELKYFRSRRHRMRYADLVAAGLPIGTGVTEAACKTLATQRLKCSGMSWGDEGGQAILTLRSLIQSDRFDAAWQLLASRYKRDVTIPDNVIPLRPLPN